MAEKQFTTPSSCRNDAALGKSNMPTIDRSIKGLRHQRVTTPKGGQPTGSIEQSPFRQSHNYSKNSLVDSGKKLQTL